MLLKHIRGLVSGFPNLDLSKALDLADTAVPIWVPEPAEFYTYIGVGGELKPPDAQVLVITVEEEIVVTAMLDVGKAGLAQLLESRLGFIPRFAILHWQFTGSGLFMGDTVVTLGHSQHNEPYSQLQPTYCKVSTQKMEQETVEAFQQDPLLNKIDLIQSIAGLDSKNMLAKKPHQYGTEVHPLTRMFNHGIQ